MERNITGLHGIEEALKAGKQQGRLFLSRKSSRINNIKQAAEKTGIEVVNISPGEMNKRFGDETRGVVLQLFSTEAALSVSGKRKGGDSVKGGAFEEIIDALDTPNPLVLILDGVTDPHNYGAILRSADQFGVDLVLSRSRRSVSENDTVARTSSGAVNFVPTSVVNNLNRSVDYLKKNGYWVYAADMGDQPLYKMNLTGKTAIVMGSEGKGVSRLLSEKCDGVVSIPSSGHIDSLNVSVAAGIILYEIRRQQA
ncbi:MAG: 23S rRNA (guanosine(2251)-2'-O)-methyltransferase RlmB [Spirochaetales bacterium]|uniref:23S rRNA (Guanosine(2251)-2'-O)-methyltransferase RlmB n=1 Tax=Candidatus Thalassospirochaeta sargassi TaxID=3119039 RepID=A0AAJ1MIX0_9SPIO|nr:23S rRNA (guanosine(2251)-2'-O)-methyltransferase RlmB [Spirochaetales bacterium]